jgi:phosphoribosyl-AMP cyclohydrolase
MSKEHTTQLQIDFGPDGQQLIPVVTQDARTKDVLILAFANREAFDETRRSGYATYWSRSRKELWKKGLTSGDMLKVEEIRVNCEQNSLVFLVTPQGRGACHAKQPDGSPYKSCYYRRVLPDDTLEVVAAASPAPDTRS